MVETAEMTTPQEAPVRAEPGHPAPIDPDFDFIRTVSGLAGGSFKACMQCGLCSGTCELSPEHGAFPRKEMAWATWGRRDLLLTDVDVWLCHQCNDCSTVCPRDVRPGDVIAAVRRECAQEYSLPRFLAGMVGQPKWAPFLLAIPTLLLVAALLLRDPIASALDIQEGDAGRIVYSYSRTLPHWLVNGIFIGFGVLALFVMAAGASRYWRALRAADRRRGIEPCGKGFFASLFSALKSIFAHDRFTACTTAYSRLLSHRLVLFGFLALSIVTFWVITARSNPLIPDGFVYPFNFWSPWKILANLGGLAVMVGCVMMLVERLKLDQPGGLSSFPDWALLWTLLIVVGTGFLTEVLHYIRMEPHRHAAYFVHLTFVFAFLMYLPYSKLAHLVYRTTAMVYAEYSGRELRKP